MSLMLGNLVLKDKALSTEQTKDVLKKKEENSRGEFIYFYLALIDKISSTNFLNLEKIPKNNIYLILRK